ncbi:winged helix-turn-helix domain-containing protein [Colwellia sp. 12G3]|uniref:winged helix-turn-helix domain-containing protein n=1 Tax=Colwellia sp. 12G3 TaxID=2058299 RepID=UPI003FA4829C
MYCSKCPLNFIHNFKDDLSISSHDQTISFNNNKIKFSSRAFRVLCALLREKDKPISFSYLQTYGWPDSLVVKNNLTVVISEIRTNLRHTQLQIENIRGYGYMLTSVEVELVYNGRQQCIA